MQEKLIEKFETMGARLVFARPRYQDPDVALDVRSDRRGEHFEIRMSRDDIALEVVDLDAEDRHLLLLVRTPVERSNGAEAAITKSKYLMGHDERHWFVASIPEKATSVRDVRTAKLALQPNEVRAEVARKKVKARKRSMRRNEAFVRQGEWFFVPAPDLVVSESEVLRDEPLVRGRGKPHFMEQAYRTGGTPVWFHRRHAPGGITEEQRRKLPPEAANSKGWQVLTRGAEVYARGRITHPDHSTVLLQGWHRVLVNTEHEAKAARTMVFLD